MKSREKPRVVTTSVEDKDDPDVRLEIDVGEDVLGSVAAGNMERGRVVSSISSSRVLDDILGQKWDERIVNFRGDYCFVIEGTVIFFC